MVCMVEALAQENWCKIMFVSQNLVKFIPTVNIFGTKLAESEVHCALSFHLTSFMSTHCRVKRSNVDVPNGYITL